MIKISVILTTYNSELTVEDSVNSILNQKGINEHFEIELIAIDDGSTDSTVDLLKNFPIQTIFFETNSGGPNRGRNTGLRKATGDYITFLDHDDIWDVDRIISLLPFFDKEPILTSGYTVVDHNKNVTRKVIPKKHQKERVFNIYPRNETFHAKLSRDKKSQISYLGSIFIKRDLKHHYFEEQHGQIDFDWILRIFKDHSSLEYCESLFTRNVWNNNLSLDEEYRKNDYSFSIDFLTSFYQNSFPSQVNLGIKRINGSMGRYYYRMEKMGLARKFFKKSNWSIKTALYYITSFVGYKCVNKRINVFG